MPDNEYYVFPELTPLEKKFKTEIEELEAENERLRNLIQQRNTSILQYRRVTKQLYDWLSEEHPGSNPPYTLEDLLGEEEE